MQTCGFPCWVIRARRVGVEMVIEEGKRFDLGGDRACWGCQGVGIRLLAQVSKSRQSPQLYSTVPRNFPFIRRGTELDMGLIQLQLLL